MKSGTNEIVFKRDCPICGNAEVRLIFTQAFARIDGINFLGGYDVVSCKKCCFVYASNVPKQAAFDEYYMMANKYELETEQSDAITGKDELLVQEIIHLVPDKTTPIVDIGCAKSEILRSLLGLGFSNLTGIDPSVKNVEYLKGKGINAVHATINTIDTSKQYNIVLFLMVLEHIRDLHLTLDILYAITAINGTLILSVPDMTAPFLGEFPYQEFSLEHINYFTEVSLSNLMIKYGFRTVFYKKKHGAIIGFFRKESKPVQKDTEGEQRILRYIDRSKKEEDAIYANLLRYSDIPIIVWGLGTFTRRLLVKKVLKNIVVIVDSNPQYAGHKYNNIDIIPPNNLKWHTEPIVLAVSPRYIDAITHTVKNVMRLENEIITLC